MKKILIAVVALFGFAGAAYATDAVCDANCVAQSIVAQSYVAPVQAQTVRVVERVIQPQVYHEVRAVVAAPVQAVVERQYVVAPVVVQKQAFVQQQYVRQNVIQQQYQHSQAIVSQNLGSYGRSNIVAAQRGGLGSRLFNRGGGRTVTRSFSSSVTKSR
jgi:hypothetical protein